MTNVKTAARWPVSITILFTFACGSAAPTVGPTSHVAASSTESSTVHSEMCGMHLTPTRGLRTLPTVAWRAQTGGRIVVGPTELTPSGDIVIGSLDGWLYRFTAEGSPVWRLDTGAPIRSQALAIADDNVVVANEAGTVVRVRGDGTVVWRRQLAGKIATDPFGECGGTFRIAADGIYAINVDGSVLWHHIEPTTVYEQPFIDTDARIVFGTVDGRVVTLDPCGRLHTTRRKAPDEPIRPRIAPRDDYGVTYAVGPDQMLRATRSDGSELWGYSVGANVTGNVLLTSSGTLLLGTDDGTLYALH